MSDFDIKNIAKLNALNIKVFNTCVGRKLAGSGSYELDIRQNAFLGLLYLLIRIRYYNHYIINQP